MGIAIDVFILRRGVSLIERVHRPAVRAESLDARKNELRLRPFVAGRKQGKTHDQLLGTAVLGQSLDGRNDLLGLFALNGVERDGETHSIMKKRRSRSALTDIERQDGHAYFFPSMRAMRDFLRDALLAWIRPFLAAMSMLL